MLKTAIVGVGGISGSHLKGYRRIPEVSLTVLCDVRPERLEGPVKEFGSNPYTDFDTMLKKDKLDVLDICTPSYLHKEMAIKAMDRGIHVISEKPLAFTRADAQEMFAAAERNGVHFMVAHVLRFWPEYRALREMVSSGEYGRLLGAKLWRLNCAPRWSWDNWMLDRARSGLVPFDLHIHDLDFLVWTLGKPDSVQCVRERCPDPVSDHLTAIYRYGDAVIEAEASWYPGAYPFHAGYTAHFERAAVEYKDGVVTVYESGKEPRTLTFEAEAPADSALNLPATDAYYSELRYFIDRVLHDQPIDSMTPEELYTVLDILHQDID